MTGHNQMTILSAKTWNRERRVDRYGCGIGLGLLAMVLLAGCGDSGQSLNTSTGENASSLTPYVGVQPFTGLFGGVWSTQVDHKTNYFNLMDVDYYVGSQSFVGNFQNVNGFLNLKVTSSAVPLSGPTSSPTQPYAIEHAGDGMLMEPDGGEAPVILTANSTCPTLKNQSYQFIELAGLGGRDPGSQGYGRVTVNAAESAWTFSNYNIVGMDGTDQKPAALGSAVCAQTAEGYVATMPMTVNGASLTYTAAVSSSGMFVMDRDWHGGQLPLAGMAVPSRTLDTNALESAEYIGFEYDWFDASPQILTRPTNPVHFSGGSPMQGGLYPSSDASQAPGSDIAINMGTEDPKNNGFYPSVTVTLPDVRKNCLNQPYGDKNAAGDPVCIFPGVAVASNAGGKFDLLLSVQNPSDKLIPGENSVIQFFLFQK
jgi:hypothetical protein